MQGRDRLSELVGEEEAKRLKKIPDKCDEPMVKEIQLSYKDILNSCDILVPKINEMSNIVSEILSGVNSAGSYELSQRASSLSVPSETIIQDVSEKLRRIESSHSNFKEKNPHSIFVQMKENLYCYYLDYFIQFLNHYRNVSDKLNQQIEFRKKSFTYDNAENLEESIEESIEQKTEQQQLTLNQGLSEEVISDIASRHQEIQKLEKNISDIACLFQDVAFITSLSAKKIDRIETYVSKATAYVDKGKENLKQAKKYQNNSPCRIS